LIKGLAMVDGGYCCHVAVGRCSPLRREIKGLQSWWTTFQHIDFPESVL